MPRIERSYFALVGLLELGLFIGHLSGLAVNLLLKLRFVIIALVDFGVLLAERRLQVLYVELAVKCIEPSDLSTKFKTLFLPFPPAT